MAWAFPKAAGSTFCFLSPSESSLGCRSSNRNNTFPSKIREASSSEIPTMSTITAVPGSSEKLHVVAVKAHSSIVAAGESMSYKTEAIYQQPKATVEAAMATETLYRSEEASIAAAAAEAMALAHAAVKAAKDAAAAWAEAQSLVEFKEFPSEADLLRLERARLTEMERLGTMEEFNESKPSERDSEAKCGSNKATSLNVCSALERESAHSLKNKGNSMWVSHNIERATARSRRRLKSRARKAKSSLRSIRTGSGAVSVERIQKAKKTVVPPIDFSDPLRLFRQSTNSRFLTASEEAEFSQNIQDMLKLERIKTKIEQKIGRAPTPTQWAKAVGLDRTTLERKLSMGRHCKEKIIGSCIRLVISVAKIYQGRGMCLQDLVQEGCIGLMRGAEKFDHRKGFKFSTYVHWWIRQAVTRAIAKQSRTIRLPVYIVDTLSRIRGAKEILRHKLGRPPRDDEVADLLGLSISRVRFVIKCSRFPRSIEQQIGRDDDRILREFVADPDVEGPETTVTKQLLRQDIDKVLDTLRPKEKEVVRLRFGLDDGRVKSRNEIGQLFCVSGERIRQIECDALGKLRQNRRNNDLRHYLDI